MLNSTTPQTTATLIERSEVSKSVDDDAVAISVSAMLNHLRRLLNQDSPLFDLARTVVAVGFFETLLTSSLFILKFSSLTEETQRIMLPIIRLPSLRSTSLVQLIENGGLQFILLSIKLYGSSQGLEILAALLEHIEAVNASNSTSTSTTNNNAGTATRSSYATQSAVYSSQDLTGKGLEFRLGLCMDLDGLPSPSSGGGGYLESKIVSPTINVPTSAPSSSSFITPKETVHLMLLYSSTLCISRQLQTFIRAENPVGAKRAIYCLSFLVKHSPPQLSTKVATVDNGGVVLGLYRVLTTFNHAIQIDAVVLLLGLIAGTHGGPSVTKSKDTSNSNVVERLANLDAWGLMLQALQQDGVSYASRIPDTWLRNAVQVLVAYTAKIQSAALKKVKNINNNSSNNDGGDGSMNIKSLLATAAYKADLNGPLMSLLVLLQEMIHDEPAEDAPIQQATGVEIEFSEKIALPVITSSKGTGVTIRDDDRVNAILVKSGDPYLIPLQWEKQWADAHKPKDKDNVTDKMKDSTKKMSIEKDNKVKELVMKTSYPVEMLSKAKVTLSSGRPSSASATSRKKTATVTSSTIQSDTLHQTSSMRPSSSSDNRASTPASNHDKVAAEQGSKKVTLANGKGPHPKSSKNGDNFNPLAASHTQRFVAEKLFNVTDSSHTSTMPSSTSVTTSSSSTSALDKLSFKERLQVMMMQLKDQEG